MTYNINRTLLITKVAQLQKTWKIKHRENKKFHSLPRNNSKNSLNPVSKNVLGAFHIFNSLNPNTNPAQARWGAQPRGPASQRLWHLVGPCGASSTWPEVALVPPGNRCFVLPTLQMGSPGTWQAAASLRSQCPHREQGTNPVRQASEPGPSPRCHTTGGEIFQHIIQASWSSY